MFGRSELIQNFRRNLFLSRTCFRRGAAISAELTSLEKKYKIDLKRAPSLFAFEMSHRKVIERLLIGKFLISWDFFGKNWLQKMKQATTLFRTWGLLFRQIFRQFWVQLQRKDIVAKLKLEKKTRFSIFFFICSLKFCQKICVQRSASLRYADLEPSKQFRSSQQTRIRSFRNSKESSK